MRKIYPAIFLALFGSGLHLAAQELQSDLKTAAANYFTGDGYSISWTIGEAIILTVSDSTIIMTQGFQQPTLRLQYTDKKPPQEKNVKIGPNPSNGPIDLFVDRPVDKNISIQADLYDLGGRRVYTDTFQGREFRLDMAGLASGIYYLRLLMPDGTQIGVYKLQKVD